MSDREPVGSVNCPKCGNPAKVMQNKRKKLYTVCDFLGRSDGCGRDPHDTHGAQRQLLANPSLVMFKEEPKPPTKKPGALPSVPQEPPEPARVSVNDNDDLFSLWG